MTAIKPSILSWARETAGLSLEDAARSLGLSDTKRLTASERLAGMEQGEEEPSRTILQKMTKVYRRPLLVFYLAEPPRVGDRGQDFRTLPGAKQIDPDLDALVRDIKARQGLIRSMLEDDHAETREFIGSASVETSADALASRIRNQIGFDLERFRASKDSGEAFAYMRERIEASGVYVLLLGNLGSHHTNIAVESFRGFALADPIAPLIVINDRDARSAWSFTAIHELAHLWLGQTGISGTDTLSLIERFCNDVAGEFLLPSAELRTLAPSLRQGVATIAREIASFAETRRVSRSMVAYKLNRIGLITNSTWTQLDRHLQQEWQKHRDAERSKPSKGGPNYYVVRRHRIGNALLMLVRRSLDEGTITYTKASRVLGVRPSNIESLLSFKGVR